MPSSFDVNAKVNLDPRSLGASAKKMEMALGRITGQASEFQKSLDASTARVFAFGATTAVLNGVNQAFKKLVSTTIEVQKRLVEINSIFQATEKTFNRFRNAIFQVAKDTGQAFDTVAEGAAELARQGLSAEETAKRLKASLVLTRISGLGAEKSVKALTAAINGFASAGLSANQIVNKMVAVDTAFAVSAQDLAEGFSRAGSTAEDAGVSFNELLGLITAVEQKTARGGAVIGNAFKSIFTRLSRGDTIESLRELGVQIDANMSGVQKLSALSDALGKISDPTVASAIKELAGGVFQINVVSAALKDLSSDTSIFAGAAKTASDATNEAFQKNAALNQTIAAQINSLIVGLTSLGERIGSITFGPLLENLIGLTTKFTEFLDKALDPEKGNKFIKGLFSAIGSFLSGPAVVIFTTAFVKIFALVAKFAKDGLKAVFAIGSESTKIKNVEAGIVGLLQRDKDLRNIILSSTVSQAQKETAVINAIKAENTLLAQQAALMNSIAGAAVRRGVGGFSQTSGKFKFASGFQQEEAMARGLGATGGVKAHYGEGTIGGRKFIMNNQETEIPRFGGGRDSAVIPMYPMGYPAGTGSAAGLSKKRRGTKRGGKGTLLLDGSSFGLLSALSGTVPPVSTTGINTLSAISKKGITAAGIPIKSVKQVQLSGLNVSSLDKGKKNFKSQYQSQVTKSFAAPLINFGAKMVGETFSNNDKKDITNKLKRQKSTKLFSSSTEGGIFESALRMVMAGSRASGAFKGTNERAPFDFEEKGSARRPFVRRFFPQKNIARADAKRTADKDSARSFIHKILQDQKARGLARPRLAASGHLPKFAKGSKGGGLGEGSLLSALFALSFAMDSFGVGVDESTDEVTAFGSALRTLVPVLMGLTVLQGLSSLGPVAKGLGFVANAFKNVGAAGGRTLGMSRMGQGLGSMGQQFKGGFKGGYGKGGGFSRWAGAGLKNVGSKLGGVAGRAAPKWLGGAVGRAGLGAAGSSLGGVAAAAGPIGLAIGAAFVGKAIGSPIGEAWAKQIRKNMYKKGTRDMNQKNLGFAGLAGVEAVKRKLAGEGFGGRSDQIEGFDEFAGDNENVNIAMKEYRDGLFEAAKKTKSGNASLEDKIKLEDELERKIREELGIKGETIFIQQKITRELERLKPKLADYAANIRIASRNLIRSASEGIRKSGIATERAGIAGSLELPDGPNLRRVQSRVASGGAFSTAGASEAKLLALQSELATTTDPTRLKELPKEIKDASSTFRKDVIEGGVGFKNRINSLNKELRGLMDKAKNISSERTESNISAVVRGQQNAGLSRATENDFINAITKLNKLEGSQFRRGLAGVSSDPKFIRAAEDMGTTVQVLLTAIDELKVGGGVFGGKLEQNNPLNRFTDNEDLKKKIKDATGTNFDKQINEITQDIIDTRNAISDSRKKMKDFFDAFGKGAAAGVPALVKGISNDLEGAVLGQKSINDGMKKLDAVNSGVVETAAKTAELLTTSAGKIDHLTKMWQRLGNRIEALEGGNGAGVGSQEVPQ